MSIEQQEHIIRLEAELFLAKQRVAELEGHLSKLLAEKTIGALAYIAELEAENARLINEHEPWRLKEPKP